MSEPYEEILGGDPTLRLPLTARHELVLDRLRLAIQAVISYIPASKLLETRSPISVTRSTTIRPDLALITAAGGKLWLAAEVISSEDHQTDTVTKKQIYEDIKVPRLWIVDPRYDNIEVYHATEYGLKLMGILAGAEVLEEKLLPNFRMVARELFSPASAKMT